jgi:hypothetical protein
MPKFMLSDHMLLALAPELAGARGLTGEQGTGRPMIAAELARCRAAAVESLISAYLDKPLEVTARRSVIDFSKITFPVIDRYPWDPMTVIEDIRKDLDSGPLEIQIFDPFRKPTEPGVAPGTNPKPEPAPVRTPGAASASSALKASNAAPTLHLSLTCPNCKHGLLVTTLGVVAIDLERAAKPER